MKRTSLTTAVIAGIAGVAGISNMASAVYLNNDGLGQVLFYPYYTVNGGNITLLTVVNTTNLGKAVKVRFLEAYNSREVLDFNLYLSPHDVWTAGVVPTAGGAGVFTSDNSCTVPQIPTTAATAQPFLTYAYDGTGGNEAGTGNIPSDGGPTGVARTLEGYVELIEMGTVYNGSPWQTLRAITHKNGVPANCAQVRAAWGDDPSFNYWAGTSASIDITNASGGLFGSGAIVNVDAGVISGYNADAIDQFYVDSSDHEAPGSLLPSLSSGDNSTSYVFAPTATSTTPTLVTTDYLAGVDAVSSLFMADAIYNEYWTGGGTSASSEWVVTFPTKRYYVDDVYINSALTTNHRKPFDAAFAKPGVSCSPIKISIYDREEKTTTTTVGFSPSKGQQGTNLCFESQVVTFGQPNITTQPSAILGSAMTANIPTIGNNGWALIDLYNGKPANHILPNDPTYYTTSTHVFRGLPVTGFWVTSLVNGNLNGVLSNYSALFRHKLHRTCSSNNDGNTICS